jgi:hypothetical protein
MKSSPVPRTGEINEEFEDCGRVSCVTDAWQQWQGINPSSRASTSRRGSASVLSMLRARSEDYGRE